MAQWRFSQNTFLINTERNYRRANQIGLFTYNVFLAVPAGDASLNALKTYYLPRYEDYKAKYDAWKAAGAQNQGATMTVYQVETLINNDVNDWQYTILGTYKKETPGYIALFPEGITTFKTGNREQRITRLTVLSTNLALTPSLAAVKALVDARIIDLQNATSDKSSLKNEVALDSQSVEASRLALCTALYYVLGGLMQVYADAPLSIEAYFDLEELRQVPQHTYSGAVHAGNEPTFIVRRTMKDTDEIQLFNNGMTNLSFYWSQLKIGLPTPPPDATHLAPGGVFDSVVSDMPSHGHWHYLVVSDDNSLIDGHYTVVI